MSRFVMYFGHSEIGIRCDSEPSTLSFLEAVKKALLALNVAVHSEQRPGDGSSWAIIHAAWLHNRFVVRSSVTGCEKASGRFFGGKVAMYGECVLGFFKTTLKEHHNGLRGFGFPKLPTMIAIS